jgi:hypothetical protein
MLTMKDYGREGQLSRTTKPGRGYVALPQNRRNYVAGALLSNKYVFPDVSPSFWVYIGIVTVKNDKYYIILQVY